MKRNLALILILFFAVYDLYSQSASQQLRELYRIKEYTQAATYIKDALKSNPKDEDLHVLAGDIYFELDKLDSALIMYNKADDIKSNVPAILRKIGKTLSLLGRHDEAINILKKAIKEKKDDVYNHLELGSAYIRADSLRQAELTITKAREMNKRIPDAFVALGDLYFAQRVYPLARTNYEEALALDENLTDARVKLATTYYWLANQEIDRDLANELFTRSLKEWNIITQKDPKNARAFREQGRILFFARKFGEAAQSFNRFLELRPDDILIRWYFAQSLVEIGKCDSALPQLQIVKQSIDSVKDKATLKLAQCYFEQKRFKESVESYNLVKPNIKLDNIDIERLAVAYLRIEDTTNSIITYKDLFDSDTTKCRLMYQIGQLSMLIKNWDLSIHFFSRQINYCKDSLNAKSYDFIGKAYFNMGNSDSALANIIRSLEIDQNGLSTRTYLADIYMARANKEGKKEEKDLAKSEYKKVITIGLQDTAKYSRELTSAFNKYCGVLLEEKNFRELEKYAKDWTEFDPKLMNSWLYLAIAYQGQSKTDDACRSYKKVLQIDPKNSIAKKNFDALNCGGG